MCTVIVLRRPGAAWPTLAAANRDERLDRAWDPPGPHWTAGDGTPIRGGRDRAAGGTWLAVNRAGVMAAVLNRSGSLGPAPGKRSRGELPLLALEAPSAAAAARRIAGLDAALWRPFHMVLADAAGAWFLLGRGEGQAEAAPLGEGVSVVTAHPPNDLSSPRIARHLPRFAAAAPPAPPDWGAWPGLLGDAAGPVEAALNIPPLGGFGTVCAALLGWGEGARREFLFAPGPPDRTKFSPVPWD